MANRRVIIESPLAGEVEENLRYLRLAMRDSLLRFNEAPFASHALYAQPGLLDDLVPEERRIGIEAGLLWGEVADASVVYTDRGISQGMKLGLLAAAKAGRPVEYRTVPGYISKG